MLVFDAICGVPEHLAILLFAFDAWFRCYLSWPEALLDFIVCLRCLTLSVYVVFQNTWPFYCLPSMLVFDAICRGRRYFWKSLIAFDAWFWCYLWCSRALGHFIVCLRCLILMLFVVAGGTFRSPCFSSMLAIVCLVKRYSRMLWLELQLQYLVCLPSILDFDGCFLCFWVGF